MRTFMSPQLLNRLKAIAYREGRTPDDFLRALLDQYEREHPAEDPEAEDNCEDRYSSPYRHER